MGDNNAPDIIEEGRGVVDLLFKYDFPWRDYDIGFEAKAGNVLSSKIEWTQDDMLYEKWSPGITYSVGLRVTF